MEFNEEKPFIEPYLRSHRTEQVKLVKQVLQLIHRGKKDKTSEYQTDTFKKIMSDLSRKLQILHHLLHISSGTSLRKLDSKE